MKFVIVSPRQKWGGAIVLHALCKCLENLGYSASIFYTEVYGYDRKKPIRFWAKWILYTLKDFLKSVCAQLTQDEKRFSEYLNPSIKGCRRKVLPWVDDQSIVVYSDTVFGNFLDAKNVVRWFLYHNRYKNQAGAYGENDLFVCYREVFNDVDLNPNKLTVHTPYFDLDTYKQYNFGERHGTCYVVRKGIDRPDLPKEFDGTIIDNLSEKEKVKVLNECEYCISYDTQTSYSEIAALCGCISIVVPEPGKTKADYIGPDDCSDGIAWGFSDEEMNHAKQTRHMIYIQYLELNESSRKSAEEFARICEVYFKKDIT